MTSLESVPERRRNPHTQALIRRETFWQVFLPLIVALLLAVGAMVLVVMSTVVPVQTSALADVSLMFLILLAAGGGLVILALFVGLCVLVWYGLRELPFLFRRVQDFMWMLAMNVKSATRQVDSRVVEVHLSLATLRSIGESFRTLFNGRRAP